MFREAMTTRYGAEALAEHYRSFDTICSATQERQDAVIDLLNREALDLMVVVGGYNSSNTCNLARICAERVPTFHIAEPECLVSADRIRHRPVPGAGPIRRRGQGARRRNRVHRLASPRRPAARRPDRRRLHAQQHHRYRRRAPRTIFSRRVGVLTFTPSAAPAPFAGRAAPVSKQPFRAGRIVGKRERRMSRTMSTLVVVGLMLAAGGRSEAAQLCGNPRDMAAEALLAECAMPQAQGGAAAQEGAEALVQMVARRRSAHGFRHHRAAVERSRSDLPADAADAEGEEGGRGSRGEGPVDAAGRGEHRRTNRRSCRRWRRWKRRAARCRAPSR